MLGVAEGTEVGIRVGTAVGLLIKSKTGLKLNNNQHTAEQLNIRQKRIKQPIKPRLHLSIPPFVEAFVGVIRMEEDCLG